jgi:cell division septal protein FtsQ
MSTLNKMNPDIMQAVDDQIKHVRKMQNLTDVQIRDILLKSNMQEILREGALKRNLKDIAKVAKDIHGDPRKFARKIDRF